MAIPPAVVATSAILGVLIQYVGTGELIGWWVLLPLPFVVVGEMVRAGRRRRPSGPTA